MSGPSHVSRSRVQRLPEDELRKFVDDLVSNRIFTSADLGETAIPLIRSVFLPLALGALADFSKEEFEEIGCIYEDMGKRQHWAVNGYPTFFSCKILHKDDWEIARKAALAEYERRKSIPL